MKRVECVPNFSDGRDPHIIESLAQVAAAVEGVQVLHVDAGADAHRTVMTLIGDLEAVGEAAFRAISLAGQLIDMTRHKGVHPRLGATDVCPFVPLAGTAMADCVELARRVGARVGAELGIPVYLYGEAAAVPERRNLAELRRGEYEGLRERMAQSRFKPDFGPAQFNPRSGATAIGARDLLIAFNVSLNTTDRSVAQEIARDIREQKDGSGGLKGCRAIGWLMASYGSVQVSMNLVDFRVTPPHVALEEVRRQARDRGLEVTGSELIGMIPLEAMLAAGRYYLQEQGRSPNVPEEELVNVAIDSLGLSSVRPFDPRERILEYRLRQAGAPWDQWAAGLLTRPVPEDQLGSGEIVGKL